VIGSNKRGDIAREFFFLAASPLSLSLALFALISAEQ
jgi:hypothetical protein